jgi:hypothetical protein
MGPPGLPSSSDTINDVTNDSFLFHVRVLLKPAAAEMGFDKGQAYE